MTAYQIIANTLAMDARRRKAIAKQCEANALLTIWTQPTLSYHARLRITRNIQAYVVALTNGIDAEGLN